MAGNEIILHGREDDGEYKKKRFAQNRVPPRITVVENVYHQLPNEQPTQASMSFTQELESSEDPFLRRMTATEDWKPLDFGWLESLSMIHIENREGMRLAVQPEIDERVDIAKRVLEIGFSHPGADTPTHENRIIVLPGKSSRFALSSTAGVLVRCRHGQASFFMAAFPG